MIIAKFPELDRILIDDINVVERCTILDVIEAVPLRIKSTVIIDDVLVLRFDDLGAFYEAFDCLNQIRMARLTAA